MNPENHEWDGVNAARPRIPPRHSSPPQPWEIVEPDESDVPGSLHHHSAGGLR